MRRVSWDVQAERLSYFLIQAVQNIDLLSNKLRNVENGKLWSCFLRMELIGNAGIQKERMLNDCAHRKIIRSQRSPNTTIINIFVREFI